MNMHHTLTALLFMPSAIYTGQTPTKPKKNSTLDIVVNLKMIEDTKDCVNASRNKEYSHYKQQDIVSGLFSYEVDSKQKTLIPYAQTFMHYPCNHLNAHDYALSIKICEWDKEAMPLIYIVTKKVKERIIQFSNIEEEIPLIKKTDLNNNVVELPMETKPYSMPILDGDNILSLYIRTIVSNT